MLPLPPIPPGIEQLRVARDAIDPSKVYALEMPDGSLVCSLGSSLIETAEGMVALVDAQESGDENAIRAAVERIAAHEESLSDSIVICVRIGQVPDQIDIPTGTLTTDCFRCGAALWISPDGHRRVAAGLVKPVCRECVVRKAKSTG